MSGVIIVESPAKTKTITGYLRGQGYKVLASYGHVRDLPSKQGAVDVDHNFEMTFQEIERNEKHVNAIAKALEKADTLLLATDPDREGEAIAWHVVECLRKRKVLTKKHKIKRIKFNEITKSAINEAVSKPEEINEDLLNAWRARRVLDYLVGFNLSPLLWLKVKPGLSAGRVQSPALRLVVEREAEIRAFEPKEYWTIEANCHSGKQDFLAKLTRYKDEKIKQFTINEGKEARKVTAYCEKKADGKLEVINVEKKQRKRNPPPPFMTSTLQQEASRKLGFGARKTMMVAQSLYEGVELKDGKVGLITYMRTDSLSLSQQAIKEIRAFIERRYGADNVPAEANVYRSKAKNSQEAHEAIRVTSPSHDPESLSQFLNKDQIRLYELIWQRTLACQMIPATLDTVSVDLACGEPTTRFRANGSTIVDPGFMAVYQEGVDDKKQDDHRQLPPMKEGDKITLKAIVPEQHFTEPPPRYSEATLVKALEEYGIGRPSTYASIVWTIQQRGYAELQSRRFVPTDIGIIVSDFLSNHFTDYVDYNFTANLEDTLDHIAAGEAELVPVLKKFWKPFKALVDDKKESVSREEVAQARHLGSDPKTGKPVSVRIGRYGPFAQIGTKEDEEKPKFAGLLTEQSLHTITLKEALALFRLPRKLGKTEEGESIEANIGRFGPYVKYGSKYVSLKDDDPYKVKLDRALELIEEKKKADAEKLIQAFAEEGIKVQNGHYGPYVTDGKLNAKIPKDEDPKKITLERIRELLAQSAAKKKKKRR